MVTRSSTDIEDDLRHILQRVHNFMVKDIEAGDDLLWTDEYGDLYRDVSDVLASQLETRASLTTASGEAATATETCGFCTGKGYVVKAHFEGGTYTADCPACTVTHQPVTKADQP